MAGTHRIYLDDDDSANKSSWKTENNFDENRDREYRFAWCEQIVPQAAWHSQELCSDTTAWKVQLLFDESAILVLALSYKPTTRDYFLMQDEHSGYAGSNKLVSRYFDKPEWLETIFNSVDFPGDPANSARDLSDPERSQAAKFASQLANTEGGENSVEEANAAFDSSLPSSGACEEILRTFVQRRLYPDAVHELERCKTVENPTPRLKGTISFLEWMAAP